MFRPKLTPLVAVNDIHLPNARGCSFCGAEAVMLLLPVVAVPAMLRGV